MLAGVHFINKYTWNWWLRLADDIGDWCCTRETWLRTFIVVI